jgi:hypothetical protein
VLLGWLVTIGTTLRRMNRRCGLAILMAVMLVLVVAPPASLARPKLTGQDGATRHTISRVAAALRMDGLKLERPGSLYEGVCPQLLPRRRTDGYTILVSTTRACDAVLRHKKTLTHLRGRTWVFAARFDNTLLLYNLVDQQMTAKAQALVGFLSVFAVIHA